MNDFTDLTSPQLLDIILQADEQSDEAMYYVLKERVYERLKEKYQTHEHVFFEDFEDVVDDFFPVSARREWEGTRAFSRFTFNRKQGCI